MKKYSALFFILFSIGTLSAQNLNFKDTNGLKNLLCSHTWYRYSINPDSSFSDRVMDSITFYKNGTLFKSQKPKYDSLYYEFGNYPIPATWHFSSTGRVSSSDSATNCISLDAEFIKDKMHILLSSFCLFDGHRMKGTKMGKRSGNIDKPFIGMGGTHSDFDCNMSDIWQPSRVMKKAKKK
ncbi:MAG TPA: hypothetical protein VK809_12745 [Bacteroidia bacterium]|jgi:hypothetical protein|nr:hypothetical protein [Bacteroidia bacterium]